MLAVACRWHAKLAYLFCGDTTKQKEDIHHEPQGPRFISGWGPS